MLDINFIRQNKNLVIKTLKNRNIKLNIDKLLLLDEKRRTLKTQIDNLRQQKNKLSQSLKSKKPDNQSIKKSKKIKNKLNQIEKEYQNIYRQYQSLMYQIPNIPSPDTPIGKDESDNKVLKNVGQKPEFKFQPKDHLELGEALDIIDVKRAAKVSGTRFGYLKNSAVLLEFALIDFALKKLIKKGFIPIIPPAINKKEIERALGYAEHGGWDQMYLFPKDKINFISSSEHTIIPQHKDEILKIADLPLRYVGFSTCFRREAGTHGKDTRGIFRVHQFDKIEMNVFTLPDTKESDKECLYLLSIQEELMQDLKIPYRIIQSCTGDLPFPDRKMYDLESWFPGQNRYRETHSCSNCTDFQTRRLNIRIKTKTGTKYVHALNATAFAIGRTIIAIIENYQQPNGSIKIPEVLIPYMQQTAIPANP